jgi:hypothetical protein
MNEVLCCTYSLNNLVNFAVGIFITLNFAHLLVVNTKECCTVVSSICAFFALSAIIFIGQPTNLKVKGWLRIPFNNLSRGKFIFEFLDLRPEMLQHADLFKA